MARIVLVVFLLTLVLAPAADAQPPDRGGAPFAGWFDAFQQALDWLFAWIPERSAPAKHGTLIEPSWVQTTTANTGVFIEPSGVTAPPPTHGTGAFIEPSGIRSVPRRTGAFIEPSGLTKRTAP